MTIVNYIFLSRKSSIRRTMLAMAVLAFTCSTGGCSSDPVLTTPNGISLYDLDIQANGKAIKSRPDMVDICKGFLLSKKTFADFFSTATYVKKEVLADNYGILPCYASGSVEINNTPYKWIIRSGGVGEFYAKGKQKRFLKVCRKDCCEKIPGMC